MKKISPESNITFYIVGICSVLIVVLSVVVSYFRSVDESIRLQNLENEQYMETASVSAQFISEAMSSQQFFNEYIFSWKKDYVERYRRSVEKMDSIIAFTRGQVEMKKEHEIFCQVKSLLDEQYKLVPKLRKRLYAENPVDKVAQDSLFTKDLNLAVGRASLSYDINIRSLRHEILNVMSLNSNISKRISRLLYDISKNTSDRSLASMEEAMEMAEKNNRYAMVIGLSTVSLIIVLSIVILFNIYKVRRTRKDLLKANREKEEVMASRHRLLLAVAHDIKTPMSSVKAYLSSSDITVEERRIMQDATSHVLALMDNLVDFSTMQNGEICANMGNFNLQDLCDRSIDLFQSLARKKGVTLVKEYRCDCDLRVNSDALKIRQILLNLISNALKYTIKGSVRVTVDCLPSKVSQGYLLQVSVEDTGVGLSEEQIAHVFEPYYRSEENRHLSNGTGLGLYVVQGMVRLLGGDIRMESQRGSGTEVFLTLPLGQYLPNSSSAASKRILVIEDDPVFRTVAKMLLSRLSHEVVASSSVVRGEFDFVLSDLNLPEVSRQEVLEAYKGIPVVLMTADTSFSKEQALSEGFRTVLYKPFSVDDVKEVFGGVALENDSIVMLGDDTVEMNSVVDTFMKSLPDYMSGLQSALEQEDILAARFVSHKMLPMFILFRSGPMIPILNRLNAVGEDGAQSYPDWRFDVESLLKMIREQYL